MRNKFKAIITIILVILFSSFKAHALFFNSNSIIKHKQSKFGPIWVYDSNHLRCLSFVPPGKIVQTCINLKSPEHLVFEYYKMFMGTFYINTKPEKILVIGLGGGVFAKTINKIFPQIKIDVVEINPTVKELAEEFFDFQENQNLKVFIADGVEFIKEKQDIYDLVIIDAFDSDYIPPSVLTKKFFQNIKNILTANGVVAINTFKNTKYSEIEKDLFKTTFGETYHLTGAGSRVIIASKAPLPSKIELRKNSRPWEFYFSQIGIPTEPLLSSFLLEK